MKAGQLAGCVSAKLGYVLIGIDNKRYLGHRLAWLYMTGKFPKDEVDHIDLNKTNNRWDNLRQATSSQNKCNAPLRSDNKAGVKNIDKLPSGRFRVRVKSRGIIHYVEIFDTIDDAKIARDQIAEKVYGEFARAS